MSFSLHLFRLQQVDRQIDQIRKRDIEISHLTGNSSDVQKAEGIFKSFEQQFKDLNSEIKKTEDAIRSKKIKIEQSESSLYGGKVSNPKELQDLQVEIASLKKNIVQLEDDLLNKMIDLEKIDLAQINSKSELDKENSNLVTRNAGLLGERSSNQVKLDNLLNERKAIIEQIDQEQMKIYENLRAKKSGVAVSEIIENVCSVCGSELTPAEWQASRKSKNLVFCSSCGRILYAA